MIEVRLVQTLSETLRQELLGTLREFNLERAGLTGPEASDFHLVARDAIGSLAGGLIGATYWDSLKIDLLVVQPAFRGQGVGSDLVERAERLAKERSCVRAHTTTYGFQALGFYRRHGYAIVGSLEDYPRGNTLY